MQKLYKFNFVEKNNLKLCFYCRNSAVAVCAFVAAKEKYNNIEIVDFLSCVCQFTLHPYVNGIPTSTVDSVVQKIYPLLENGEMHKSIEQRVFGRVDWEKRR